jgi:putative methyltransferase (TIGR04325 family)
VALGYDHGEIIDRVTAATRAVLDGKAVYEQDGIAFDSLPPSAGATLAGLLLAAASDGGRLSVLDFGGALGSHRLRWNRWLASVQTVKWSVVEQPAFVEAGRTLYEGRGMEIRFFPAIPQVDEQPNVVLASGVLQYLSHPLEHLAALVSTGPRLLLIDRTPFARNGQGKVLVQHVSKQLYPASYPLQTISRAGVAAILADRYELLDEFGTADSPISVRDAEADYSGQVWLRKD